MKMTPMVWLVLFVFFCITVLIQLLYYIFIFSRLARFKPVAKTVSQQYPVSVIVCARDEADNLYRNLPGVLVQDYRTTHEVVIVNDNSVDESKFLIAELARNFKHLHPVTLTQEAKLIPGKKFPLSMGIKSARYEILLLTDADCIPASEHWINRMQDGYGEGIDIVLGYGAYSKAPGLLNKLIRFETFHTALQYLSYALAGMPYMGVGRNLSYKRELFFRNKGFSSINMIPGGDDDLFINKVATKTNTAIVIDQEAHTLSAAKQTFGEWMAQKNRHYSTSRYYTRKHKFLLGLYALSSALVYPLLVLSAVFYCWWLALSVYALRLLVLVPVWFLGMDKLNEKDLKPYFLLFDGWMPLYYLLQFPALWKKPRNKW
jgi:glycosyltransferase involved in cell wall biosynthesis